MITPQKMARSLMDQGLTQAQIAKLIGSTQQRVSKMIQGEGCNYFTGKALENAYREVVINKKDYAEVFNEVV